MSPFSAAPDPADRRHPTYEVAVIAQVLDALASRPRDAGAAEDPAAHEGATPLPAELEDMLARAMAELGPNPSPRAWGPVPGAGGPVLGSGVLQGLIAARRRVAHGPPAGEHPSHVDERL